MGLREMLDAGVVPGVLEIQDSRLFFKFSTFKAGINERRAALQEQVDQDTYITLDCQ